MAIKALRGVILIFLLVLIFPYLGYADDKAINDEALAKTQALLRDPKQREEAGKQSPKAAATMKSAEEFVGAKHKEELYELVSEVMATMTQKTNGDAKLMNAETQKKPEDFIKMLTPEEIAKIEALAKKIEAERGPSSSLPPPK